MRDTSKPFPVLFLDTPRGPEELNHIYLVSSAGRASESLLHEYSNFARQNKSRNDFIAIRRAVKQVFRGQVREGEDVLIFCNIDSSGLGNSESLRERLAQMLDALQGPIEIEERQGMIISSPLIAKFEGELSARLDVGPAQPSNSNSNQSAVMKYAWIPLVTGILLLIFWGKDHFPDKASGGTTPPEAADGAVIPPSSDWAFLKDRRWAAFAEMTGLPPHSQDSQREIWANVILAEFSAGAIDSGQSLSLQVKNNTKIEEVLELIAVDNNALAISLRWLESQGQERLQLRDFFNALSKMPGKDPSPAQLKSILRTWWEAVAKFTSNEPEILDSTVRENLKFRPYEDDNPVKFLTEIDLHRLVALSNYLNSNAFMDRLSPFNSSNDDGWQNADWPDKFNMLGFLAQDESFDDTTPNSPSPGNLFRKLHGSISPYLK